MTVAPINVDEPRFLAQIPAAQRPAFEAKVGPALARRAADVQARAAAARQRTEAQLAELDARHAADQTALRASADQARAQGDAQIQQARLGWQTDATRVQQQHQRAIDDHHARAQTQVADMVRTGEHDVDTALTHSETDAGDRKRAADAQAQAILADGRARAAAARAAHDKDGDSSPDPSGDIEAQAKETADQVLADVMALIDDLLTAARNHQGQQVLALRQQITDKLKANGYTIDSLLQEAMKELPAIERYYQVKIDALMVSVDTAVEKIQLDVGASNIALADEQAAKLWGSTAEQQGMLSDITNVSKYNSAQDLALAFGIHFDPPPGSDPNANLWKDAHMEFAALGAVLSERAFRNSDPDGRFKDAKFGSVFQDIMGPITMKSVPLKTGGARTDETGAAPEDPGSSNTVNWWYQQSDLTHQTDGDALDVALGLVPGKRDQSLVDNVVHEFGHVLNNRARKHGSINTYLAEKSGGPLALDKNDPSDKAYPDANAKVRAGMTLGQHTAALHYLDSDKPSEQFADLFLNFVQGGFTGDANGQRDQQWFSGQLYGDTSPGAAPQRDWGLVDIATDQGPNSKFATTADTYTFAKNGADSMDEITQYYGITLDELYAANRDKLVPGKDGKPVLPRGATLTIPVPDRSKK